MYASNRLNTLSKAAIGFAGSDDSPEIKKNLFISLAASIAFFPLYVDLSLWVGAIIAVTVFVINDMCFRNRFMVPFLHVAVLLSALQLGLTAWLSWYYPPENETYSIGNRLSVYLSYAGPAILAFSVGIYLGNKLPFFRAKHPIKIPEKSNINLKSIAKELDLLVGIGIAAVLLQNAVPASLTFAMVLLSNIAFVGAFGYLLLRIPGWKIRLVAVMILLFSKTLEYGMFHDLSLWSLSSVLILGYSRRWSKKKMLTVVLIGIFSLLILLNIKQEYRKQFWYGTEFIAETRVEAFSTLVIDILLNPMVLFSQENMSETILRLNQGWIVNRTMIWTPYFEPFAEGKTIVSSILGAVVPRVLHPKKSVVGGKDDYERFTGRLLVPGTSMNLGYAGEMYANFGIRGGIIGVGIYGLLIGLGFHWFFVRASINPLWWAWAAFFAGIAIKAESSVGYVSNWIIKSVIIMIGILWCLPAMRKYLGLKMAGIR